MILENPLKNYSLTTRMRVMLECGVGYNSDLELVERITKETIANTFKQIEEAEEVEFYFREYGDSAITFLCRFWIDSESALERLRAKSKAIIQLKKAFDENDINIPFNFCDSFQLQKQLIFHRLATYNLLFHTIPINLLLPKAK